MEFETILYETRGPIATLTLNRPDKLNAINSQMVDDLNAGLDLAEGDDGVRAIVLRGAGKAFSSGFDLGSDEDAAWDDPVFCRNELRRDFDIIMRFWDSPKPTIAAVHKYCLGSALEMAVACDLTIAAEGCLFGVPEVKFGSGIVALILPWIIGPKFAKDLLLTGDDRIDAARALALGLVNRVVPDADCFDQAFATARTIAANDPIVVAMTKEAVNRSADIMGMRQALLQGLELGVQAELSESPDSKEFNAILGEQGPKAAIAWRDARLATELGES